MALGCQMVHDEHELTITTYTDGSNAFRLLDLDDTAGSMEELIKETEEKGQMEVK